MSYAFECEDYAEKAISNLIRNNAEVLAVSELVGGRWIRQDSRFTDITRSG
jgi:hypothetical protein